MPSTPRHVDRAQNHDPAWISKHLRPGTTYYYRVEAVSRHNARGPASASVAATTPIAPQCPPARVQALQAILVSDLAPVNQVNLLWRGNVEPNIAGYEIHRSTTPGFVPSPSTLLRKQDVVLSTKATEYKGFTHQMYLDEQPDPATTYHYQVRAFTTAGLAGEFSAEAGVTTKAENIPAPASRPEEGKTFLGNDRASD